ncbi:hypothetical protein ACH4GK_37850 [Streptomyces rimosus]|uniref:hypothetical protein n=1 Tax=Streptomyces rimosus TaxID=1927 RepID=UPI001F2D89E9|nr:hypothetical protein [Streptomyces rimosus]
MPREGAIGPNAVWNQTGIRSVPLSTSDRRLRSRIRSLVLARCPEKAGRHYRRQRLLESLAASEREADPAAAASALAFAALRVVEQALPEYRSSALAWLGRTEEAEAEARRAYETEQGRRWYRHNPHGADAVRRRRPPRLPASARPSTCW